MHSRKVNITIDKTTVAVTGLFHDSRRVRSGGLYFALRDNQYVFEAIQKGAVAVVSSDINFAAPDYVVKICVSDVRLAMALAAKEFYGNAVDKMRVTGVIGTNGKTTTTYILRHILEMATGKNVGLIGTNGIFNAGKLWEGITNLTTPDPIDLHRAIACMYQNGVRDVVMEVSAHAIYYQKVAGINFAGIIFTNITQDHLDFFQTFENYKNTKLSFFKGMQTGTVVINADDSCGQDVLDAIKARDKVSTVGYSLKQNVNLGTDQWVYVDDVKMTIEGTDFKLTGLEKCHLALPGLYNVYNAVAATLLCCHYGVENDIIKEALATMPLVPGRFNLYKIHGVSAVIDYAHTPDGLSQLLQNARKIMEGKGRLFVVFGCGGDRDRSKRPIMGEIAYRLADYVVITSDNPRTENPDVIIDEIERGIIVKNTTNLNAYLDGEIEKRYTRITDRESAIRYAMAQAQVGDLVVIAGKGHEDYMEINHQKIPYMDSKVLDNILRG